MEGRKEKRQSTGMKKWQKRKFSFERESNGSLGNRFRRND